MKRKIEDQPVIAICYDFDKTLTPDDMQAQGFIQSVGYDVQEFWKETNGLAQDHDMDTNLAYMFQMVKHSSPSTPLTKELLMDYGSKIELFPGVETWFERINQYGKEHNIVIEHYIISSGVKEMIEGTVLGKNNVFRKIYASSFYYENGLAVWPAQAINYTNKTQFLFRIEKGVLDINSPSVNEKYKDGEHRVPFRNIVYIGDSDTDIPCMKLVNDNGGQSIAVYDPIKQDKTKSYNMMRDKRIRYFKAADYREDSDLDQLIKAIILKTSYHEQLEYEFQKNRLEALNSNK
ncbi:haloacid dehalogenase-like hydrolase [Erysipelothrix inopinata]|uniref:Haloacid dehalogenase-like hydrolase n=1 Tax=Erysipelothrix inopinata TaxID=225084 RepID=A0A7G9RYD4_9FIRM|nr:HAD family hydrolase [Erysipelothrix inopinata]QNN60609.1 haloacid dehalogenase-like hydrolase [Erysipelothrix inopinata]